MAMDMMQAAPNSPASPIRPMPRTAWRWFPWYVVAGLGLVVAVNVVMAVLAHRSAPGVAVQGSFATSNAYGTIQQEARRQVALGWSLDISLRDGRVAVNFSGADGRPLPGAGLQATASRPTGRSAPVLALKMQAAGAGTFLSEAALPDQGQWDVLFIATSEGRSFRHTRRVIVP